MNRQLHTTVHLLRHFGPEWVMYRAGYELRKRSGGLKRALPPTSWDAQPLERFLSDPQHADPDRLAAHCASQPFLFEASDRATFSQFLSEWDAATSQSPAANYVPCVAIAEKLREGVFHFFEYRDINLGCPPNWHLHPVTGDDYPKDRHWSEIGDFGAGDIKWVWEPNRFAWAYPLVRAYWRTGDEHYPRLFWDLFEDWKGNNPPQQGVNWKCGQEVALRVMACCFALYAFADSPETTPVRIARLTQMLAVSGHRIESNLRYAVSQQNNHGITEANGLWTLGLLFPELSSADRWRRIGSESIVDQCRKLIDRDGAFSQNSVNYQRVMLHVCLWAIRLGERHGQPLPDELTQLICRAGEFLWQMQDESTGRLPRYGVNDGALVLPLTNCTPEDYRPVIQSVRWLEAGTRRFATGSWDEELLWLFGSEALDAELDEKPRENWHAPHGGYCVLRSASGHLSTRAGSLHHRPANADMLHADVWWRGQNVAIDAGTYTYNGQPPWNSPLAHTAFHNTVTVDGRDQMDRRGPFLWLPWLSGQQSPMIHSPCGLVTCWEGQHDGFRRLPSPVDHRRIIVRIGAEHWLVLDSLQGSVSHDYRLHWLLLDVPYQLDEQQQHVRLETDAGPYDVRIASTAALDLSCVRADPETPRGWYAPAYGDRQPALSLAAVVRSRSHLFTTLLGPSIAELGDDGNCVHAAAVDWTCRVEYSRPKRGGHSLVTSIALSGAMPDRLCVPESHHLSSN